MALGAFNQLGGGLLDRAAPQFQQQPQQFSPFQPQFQPQPQQQPFGGMFGGGGMGGGGGIMNILRSQFPQLFPQQPGVQPLPGGIQPTQVPQQPQQFLPGQQPVGETFAPPGQPGPAGLQQFLPGGTPFNTGGSRIAPPQPGQFAPQTFANGGQQFSPNIGPPQQQPGLPPGVQRFQGQPLQEDFGLNRPGAQQFGPPIQEGFGLNRPQLLPGRQQFAQRAAPNLGLGGLGGIR